MKIKTIVGLCISIVAGVVMSVAASAATMLTTGDPAVSGSVAMVPVYIESTDLESISSFKAFVNYDQSKATLVAVNINVSEKDFFGNENKVGTAQVGDSGTSVGWLAGKDVNIDGKLSLVSLGFSLKDTTYDFSDLNLKVDVINSESKNIVTNGMSNLGTYVKFTVPKTQTSSIAAKPWITGMTVSLDGGKTTAPIVNYTEDGDNYVFYVVLQTGTATTLGDVTLLADCAATETGTADAQFELASKSNVKVMGAA